MKKIRFALFLSIIPIVVATPFVTFFTIANSQENKFKNTYYAALIDKISLLRELKDQKKIILVGGSNVAFGFNSKLIEEEFPNYKVVNFGLYAMLGTKLMIDLSKSFINEGDMVFVIPEINSQSTSLYFNPNATWKALDEDKGLIKYLPTNEQNQMIGTYPSFVSESLGYETIIDPGESVYRRDNFEAHGDISYTKIDEDGNIISLRDKNVMKSKRFVDPKISFNKDDVSKEFINYLNEYSMELTRKGASLYYSFSPVNDLSLSSNEEEILNYYWYLKENLSFDVIGNPNEYIIDSHYFYDTNFHLNDSGSIYRSYYFVKDIYRDILKENKKPAFKIPKMPDYPPIDIIDADDDETAQYFELEENETGYLLKKINDNAKDFKTIRLPAIYNHKYVTDISWHTFENSSLEEITVPDSYSSFKNGSFDNCLSLKKVYLEKLRPNELVVDYLGGLINNVNPEFKFMVPFSSLNDYRTDYNWQFYSSYLEGYYYE